MQRDPKQHCLMIWPNSPGPDSHSNFMLVLGHLGAQRLLSKIFTPNLRVKITALETQTRSVEAHAVGVQNAWLGTLKHW